MLFLLLSVTEIGMLSAFHRMMKVVCTTSVSSVDRSRVDNQNYRTVFHFTLSNETGITPNEAL